ncbi:MAG: zinc ribbon domain-containing protein [Firmicutes bacterium]|nr:zinc ribbon domain-containing protein [Bacillota bacterium]
MGLFDKAMKQGLGEALGKAAKQLDQAVNQVSNQMNGGQPQPQNQQMQQQQYAQPQQQYSQQPQQNMGQPAAGAGLSAGLGGFFANLEKSAKSFATELGKDMKICPNCGKPSGKDQQFCPECGAKLPEETVAEGAICPNCGKQNDIGTKFCQDCGTKLPSAVAEEQAAEAADASVMAQWDEQLGAFPKWNCGGSKYNIEMYDNYYSFTAFFPQGMGAEAAVNQYRQILQQEGFQPAGQYPSMDHLYKMYNGRCLHVDLEHCFEGDYEWPTIGFDLSEPTGGFDYVKPEPKKPTGLKDLFNL